MSGRVHNPHLVARLARVQRGTLHLIGHGVDAIVQCTRRRGANWLERLLYPGGLRDRALPVEPTPAMRLDRYRDALYWHCPPDHHAREYRGELLQLQWKRARMRGADVVPLDNYRGLFPRARSRR